jgi:leucyl-tRNA synthetase
LYIGGAEHATRHLIYARFWHKFLNDIGVVSTREPFARLQSVGLIIGEDGRKMSKRFGNVVNPDDIVKNFGADSLRIYEMFMGPFDQSIPWSTDSIVGSRRFIERVWRMAEKLISGKTVSTEAVTTSTKVVSDVVAPDTIDRVINKTIQKVTDDIRDLRFNTAISTLMIALNEMEKAEHISRIQFESYLKLLAPFAPHVTEELWTTMGNEKSIHISTWPSYDQSLMAGEEVKIIVQVNGKMRGSFMAPSDISEEDMKARALSVPEAKKWLEGKSVKKVIVVRGKLVSIVVA